MMQLKLPNYSWDYFSAASNTHVTCERVYMQFLLRGKNRKLFCPKISSQAYILRLENQFSKCAKYKQYIVFPVFHFTFLSSKEKKYVFPLYSYHCLKRIYTT